MNFFGRERELAQLENQYNNKGFEMCIVYGRRRVGKTALLNQFAKGKKCVFFTAVQTRSDENLEFLSQAIFSVFSDENIQPVFRSFDDAFSYISEKAEKERIVLIIDEYPYLAETFSEISSILQRQIDMDWSKKNIFFILCGSQVNFMESEVLGEKSPLFGRRTAQMDILPFDYFSSALFVSNYTPYEKAVVYGVTGGIAKYLSLFDPDKSLNENISGMFFEENGYMYEEPLNLLRQEFRSVPVYHSIIRAIAGGATQVNQIATGVGMTTAGVVQALAKLTALRIIKKELPILNKSNKKYINYQIADGAFLFWYRFVASSIGMIERGYGSQIFNNMVLPKINEYMGIIFERMCRDYVVRESMNGKLAVLITDIGRWMGHDDENRTQREFDIVGINENTREALVGECKFRNEILDDAVVKKCIDSARLIPSYQTKEFLLFSMSGFEKGLLKKYKGQPVKFFDLEEMYVNSKSGLTHL